MFARIIKEQTKTLDELERKRDEIHKVIEAAKVMEEFHRKSGFNAQSQKKAKISKQKRSENHRYDDESDDESVDYQNPYNADTDDDYRDAYEDQMGNPDSEESYDVSDYDEDDEHENPSRALAPCYWCGALKDTHRYSIIPASGVFQNKMTCTACKASYNYYKTRDTPFEDWATLRRNNTKKQSPKSKVAESHS